MRDFSYSRQQENDAAEIEAIIKQRRRKIARQQFIYSIILAIIIGVICIWIYRRTVYAQFDGYVSLDENIFRSDEDIYFLRASVRVGDLVVPGDTLFSYAIAENFFNHLHNDYEPAIISRHRDLRVQYGLAKQDADVLRVRISELQRQLATEDHNIRLGLSDNHNKMRTEQELAEAQEQLKALERKLRVLMSAVGEAGRSLSKLNNNGHGYVRIAHMYDYELIKKLGMVYYSVATDSSIVTRKYVASNALVLRGEPIMSLQSLKARNNNLVVVAYVTPNDMKHVNYHSKAEIIVSDNVSYKGSVMMLGARTEEIPGELRSTLSRDHTASIVVFDIDPGQDIPFWSITNGVPVTIRINKLKNIEKTEGDYIIYNTATGVYPQTLMHSQHKCTQDTGYIKEHTDFEYTLVKDSTEILPTTERIKTKEDLVVGNAKGPYHIVVAAGQDGEGAERQARALRQIGYTNAKVIRTNNATSKQQYRVCICSFSDKEEADRTLKLIRRNKEFHDAWVLYRQID